MGITASNQNENTVACFESGCNHKITVSDWEYNIISGKYLPVCQDCDKNRPEFSLWDAGAIEEDNSKSGTEGIEEHPIPDDEEYTVTDADDIISEMSEEMFDEDSSKEMNSRDAVHPEIFIRNPNDSEVLRKAREEAHQMINH